MDDVFVLAKVFYGQRVGSILVIAAGPVKRLNVCPGLAFGGRNELVPQLRVMDRVEPGGAAPDCSEILVGMPPVSLELGFFELGDGGRGTGDGSDERQVPGPKRKMGDQKSAGVRVGGGVVRVRVAGVLQGGSEGGVEDVESQDCVEFVDVRAVGGRQGEKSAVELVKGCCS